MAKEASNGNNVATKPPSPSPLRNANMIILVTGGAGFIGSHLVIVANNYFTGLKDNLKKWIDVIETLLVEVDQIYHLACPASPIFYKYNPVKTIKTNVIGTLNMLGLAKRVGARILLTSTSKVYGDPLVHPQDESYWGNVNPIGVRSCYAEKRVAETLMFDYHRQHEFDSTYTSLILASNFIKCINKKINFNSLCYILNYDRVIERDNISLLKTEYGILVKIGETNRERKSEQKREREVLNREGNRERRRKKRLGNSVFLAIRTCSDVPWYVYSITNH
ncbi:hypothetical protein UlMin_003710 [Ulmus minor]